MASVRIDPEFKQLLPRLTKEEREQLEASLVAEGCRDPLVLWAGHDILLDGHNRFEICVERTIGFKTVEIELPSREAAYNWIIDNQLGRRNVTPEMARYLRGKRYNAEKMSKSEAGAIGGSSKDQNDTCLQSTSSRLASEYKVSEATIKRDGQYANAVDKLTDVIGEDARYAILGGNTPLTQGDVIELAKLADDDEDAAKAKFELLANGDSDKSDCPNDQREYEAEEDEFADVLRPSCVDCQHYISVDGRVGDGIAVCRLHEHTIYMGNNDERCEDFEEYGGASQPVEVTIFSHKSVEYYTPPAYLDAAREVIGEIDLDPASCEVAQVNVAAQIFYTEEDDGLSRQWHGRIWLNPPYSKTGSESNQDIWSTKLIEEYSAGRVTEAILLVKAALGYKWFMELFDRWPVCFARERLSFTKNDGTCDGQSKQGTAFFYLGPNVEIFKSVFGKFGRVILPER